MLSPDDKRRFRRALSSFATGVTVISTRTRKNELVGLTVNSFNSISLDPPLVSWSLRLASTNLPQFREAGRFAVNVLASNQMELSRRFSDSTLLCKFDDVELSYGLGGVPLLGGCIARFQCQTEVSHVLGDHELFVGRVVEFERLGHESSPLIFCSGSYLVPGFVPAGLGLG